MIALIHERVDQNWERLLKLCEMTGEKKPDESAPDE